MVLVLLSGTLSADSFRCGRKLVKDGDTSNTLIEKCGKPVRKYNSKETVNDRGRQVHATVSNWVYKRNRKIDTIVSVYGGTVIKIKVE